MGPICATCLTSGRHLQTLKTLEKYTDIFGDIQLNMSDFICYECKGLFMKLDRFKNQVLKAQEILLRKEAITEIKSLSNLIQTPIKVVNLSSEDRECVKAEVVCDKGSSRGAPEDVDGIGNHVKYEEVAEERNESGEIKNVTDLMQTSVDLVHLTSGLGEECVKTELICDYEDECASSHVDAEEFVASRSQVKHVAESDDRRVRQPETCVKLSNEGGPDEGVFSDYSPKLSESRYKIVKMTNEEMCQARDEDRTVKRFTVCPYKCDSCILGYFNKDQYERHVSEKHSPEVGDKQCGICHVRYRDDAALSAHTVRHYVCYVCTLCSYRSHRLNTMMIHDSKVHQWGLVYSCKKCDAQFSSKRTLRYHRDTKHRKLPSCDVCGKTLSSMSSLKVHMESHTGASYQCGVCRNSYKGKHGLIIHMRQHRSGRAGENAYCAECNKQFDDVPKYKRHVRCHSSHVVDKKRCKCPECGKGYLTSGSLARHNRIMHSSKEGYICDICSKTFIYKYKLKIHLSYEHEGISKPKNHVCPFCKKAFHARSTLENHIRLHTGEKPYGCEYCTARFKQKSTLSTHVKGVHMKMNGKAKKSNG